MNLAQMEQDLADKIKEADTFEQSSQDYLDAAKGIKELNSKIEEVKQSSADLAKMKQHNPQTVGANVPANQGMNIPSGANIQSVQPGFMKDPKRGFQSSGEFLKAIYESGGNYAQDEQLNAIMQTAGTHTTQNDGIVIPPDFAEGLLLNESGITDDWVSNLVIEPTSASSKTFKRSASNTLGGSTGITASRIAENGQMISTKEVFETATLNLHKMYAYSEVTEEDLTDIPWLSSHLSIQAPKVIRKAVAGEFLGGTGTGQALGMFNTNNPNKIQVARNTDSDVKAEDIAAMYARFINGAGSFWLINRDTLAKLPLMTVGDSPITWEPYFRNGMVGLMNGLPVYQSEHCSALNTTGDVRLINPEGYRVLEKVGGLQFASSIHVKFDYDRTAFRWTHRINGIPWCNDVYTPTNGATLSPFVELTDD